MKSWYRHAAQSDYAYAGWLKLPVVIEGEYVLIREQNREFLYKGNDIFINGQNVGKAYYANPNIGAQVYLREKYTRYTRIIENALTEVLNNPNQYRIPNPHPNESYDEVIKLVSQLRPGSRIELLAMPNDPDPIPPGTLGTVAHIIPDSIRKDCQIHVKWDNGRHFTMIVPPDKFKLTTEETIPNTEFTT